MILITYQNKIMRHQLESHFRNVYKNRNANGYPIGDTELCDKFNWKRILRRASIIVVTVEDRLVKSPIDQGDGKKCQRTNTTSRSYSKGMYT